ncbi:unnamed protein product [Rotaria socialis]|uniref:Globin domain-containing protein n=1 Tax=Rotaria socialis TaxID=392032 RepID=A0A817VM94_9BILA|nr:unnamed protein product [Rotaria socialis]CAF4768239.1 unnamed protein product [Rotaria socialis]
MGCNTSRVGITSNAMTAEQNHSLVREIWGFVCNEHYEEVGISFMIRLFQTHPELRKLWIFAANLDIEHDIRSNAQTRYHAAKIMYTLNEIISHVEDYGKRRNILESLGKTHFAYDVKPSDFQAAESTMVYVLDSILGKRFTPRHKQAWSYLFQQIIVDLGRGVEQQVLCDGQLKAVLHPTSSK